MCAPACCSRNLLGGLRAILLIAPLCDRATSIKTSLLTCFVNE